MADGTHFLRRPIPAVINGQKCELLGTGSLACAVERTPRTIRTWRAMNVLPTPFVLHPESFRNRRWLYPAGFVAAMVEIAESGIIGTTMDPMNWDIFVRMVYDADKHYILPLVGEGVTRPVVLSAVK